MDYVVIGLFLATWAQIAPIYFYLGRIMGEIRRINGNHIKEKRL